MQTANSSESMDSRIRLEGPLSGLRVVELGTLIAAPFASRLLAEFGAEVVKIESPSGGEGPCNGTSRNWVDRG
jgi:crotonobetainyl-CoA:carnitine CoA-transferase CaiB-like acyl-CoA transferase